MRYTIGFMAVRDQQAHSPDLFRTDNPVIAIEWAGMGFHVWDNAAGRQIVSPLDV